jgi:hypothetical protein
LGGGARRRLPPSPRKSDIEMHSHAHAHPSTCWTDAYLLEHCEGFRVDSNGVHVGYVEEVVWPDDGSAPAASSSSRLRTSSICTRAAARSSCGRDFEAARAPF